MLEIENWILEHLSNDHLGWICGEKIYVGKTPLISIKTVLTENSKEIVSFDKYTDLLLNFFKNQNIKQEI